VAVANSLALKSAEIDKTTPIRRAVRSNTMRLASRRNVERICRYVPGQGADPRSTAERRRRGIELVLENVAKNGITSVQDFSEWADFQAYQQLKEEGKLTVRITEWLPFNAPLNDLQNMRAQGGTKDPWLRVR